MVDANSSPPVSIRRLSATQSVQDRLDHLVQSHPQQAIVEAQSLLQASPHDPTTMLAGWAAIGRALFELGDMRGASEAMRHALREGAATQSAERLTSVRVSAAAIYAEAGNIGEGLAELARAEEDADARFLGRIQTQRAYILCHAGRLTEALHASALAETTLDRNDRLGHLRLLVNRSLIHLQRGHLGAAEADLHRARVRADRLEQALIVAGITANLGVVHARAGRIMPALQHFDEASALYEGAGNPLRMMAIMEADRAETLLHAGMFTEAVASAHLALAHARASGNIINRSDAELLLARAQLAAGDIAAAERTAAAAARTMLESRRRGVMLQARAVGLQASLAAVTDSDEALAMIARARRMAGRLDSFGWTNFGDELRCARLRCAARFGHMAQVEDDLAALRGSIRSRRPGVALRAWYAECLARAHAGDVSGAIRSARTGMHALDRLRSSTADLKMRAGLSAIGSDLTSLAMELAIALEKPSGVLTWAERTRANAVRLEASEDESPGSLPPTSTIARRLGDRTMVEFVINARHVWAVVITKSARLVKVVPLDDVVRISQQLATWMERVAQPAGTAHVGHPRELAAELDRLLIEPLRIRPGQDVVIVPVGPLHGVPWSSLPSFAGSQLVVSSSARAWLTCEQRAHDLADWSVGLLVGPEVLGTTVERRAIRRTYPNAKVVSGMRATAAGVLNLLAECDVVQIAAHGTFRPDQPLMSSLRLADGDMSMYDIAAATVRSRLVVLSSCEGGVHGARSGSEVLGLASVLLSRGAATVIAPTAIVSDHACADFVADLHHEWSRGVAIAEALSRVRQRWSEGPTLVEWATASAFTCFGSGSLTRAGAGASM